MNQIDKTKERDKVLTELYLTGRVNGIYGTKFSNSKENPLKHYIQMCLKKFYKIFNNDEYFVEEIYQMLFLELSKKDADKFYLTFYENDQLNIEKLTRTCCRIILLKGFYKLYRETANKEKILVPYQSVMTSLLHASGLALDARMINHIENIGDENEDDLIIYDVNDEDLFFDQYSFTANDVVETLSDEEKIIFNMMLDKPKKVNTVWTKKEIQQKKIALADKLRKIKNNKMREEELYNLMLPLAPKFEAYKIKKGGSLTADEMEIMKQIYKAVQEIYPSVLPRVFNTGCASCVISAYEQFITIYDRLKINYQPAVAPEQIEAEMKVEAELKDAVAEPARKRRSKK